MRGVPGGGGDGSGPAPVAAPTATALVPPHGTREESDSAKARCCRAIHRAYSGSAARGNHAGGRLNAAVCFRICSTASPGWPGLSVSNSAHAL